MKNLKLNFMLIGLLALTFTSCKKEGVEPKAKIVAVLPTVYSNVLILGNSITLAPKDLSIGWNRSCGMAASAPENDYVHLLTANLKNKNSKVVVTAKNIAQFEREFSTYPIQDSLSTQQELNADLIIIRIGENVNESGLDTALFTQKYTELIDFITKNNKTARVIAVGSFWNRPIVDIIMNKVATNKKEEFITLAPLGTDMTNYAWGLYDNSGIQQHPCDKGHIAISNLIWAQITK